MAKPPPEFGVDPDTWTVRKDSQLVPIPRVSIPMPKATTASAPSVGRETAEAVRPPPKPLPAAK